MATYSNYATWNPLISEVNSSRAYANGNRKVTLNNADDGAETTMFVPAGSKGYCEITIDTDSAEPTVGIRRSDSQTTLSSTNLAGALEYGYRGNGQKRGGAASAASYGNTFTAGDVIGVAIDTVAGAVWFSKNGTWQASATIGEVNAGTTTNAAFTGLAGFGYTFAVANSASGTTGDSFTGNFGATDFAYTQPTGFVALSAAALTPDVIDYETEYFITKQPFSLAVDDNTAGNTANNNEYDFIGNAGNGVSRTASTSDGGFIQVAGNSIPNTNGHYAAKDFGVIPDTATLDLTLYYQGNVAVSTAIMRVAIETVNYEHKIDYGNDEFKVDEVVLQVSGSNYTLPTATKNTVKIELFVDSDTLISTARISVGGTIIGTGGNVLPLTGDPNEIRYFPPTGGSENARGGFSGDLIFGIHARGNNPNTQHRLYDIAITGTGSAVTLPKSVSGGAMVRIKRTDEAGSWFGFDTVRGANRSVRWDVTEAESTNTFIDQNLTGNTFTIPSALPSGIYQIECFFVSKYFQIKGFVGDHPNVQTISYGSTMDSPPGFMVFFNRDGSTQERTMTYHIATGNAARLDITDTVAAANSAGAFGSFTPTTSQFKVGNEQNSNQDGANIISYHWANSGPYSFSQYLGNLNEDGPVISMNGSPASSMTKRNESNWNWAFHAQVLGDNENYQYLVPNANTAANSSATVNEMDFLSTGRKVRDGGNNNINGNGVQHLTMDFGIKPLSSGGITQAKAK